MPVAGPGQEFLGRLVAEVLTAASRSNACPLERQVVGWAVHPKGRVAGFEGRAKTTAAVHRQLHGPKACTTHTSCRDPAEIGVQTRHFGSSLVHARSPAAAPLSSRNSLLLWRRRRDSNPRNRCQFAGFQNRCLKPLGHSSETLRILRRRSPAPRIVRSLPVLQRPVGVA
jgi:hypothetical protein